MHIDRPWVNLASKLLRTSSTTCGWRFKWAHFLDVDLIFRGAPGFAPQDADAAVMSLSRCMRPSKSAVNPSFLSRPLKVVVSGLLARSFATT